MSVSSRRVASLVEDVEEGKLEIRPFFQRRLVWTNKDKEFFIDTVLRGFPFPEIFVATGSMDTKTKKRRQWLVDGQQRVTTLCNYMLGAPGISHKDVKPFDDLDEESKRKFMDYEVAVRDLGIVEKEEIREIFSRINSTDYALKSMELMNAKFSGAYQSYCHELSRHSFFKEHKVFSAANKKRMYDVAFCVILVTTILSGYYRRDERNEEYLGRYNDEFDLRDKVQASLESVFSFLDQCGLGPKSRAWKQTDLFTLIVELELALAGRVPALDPTRVGAGLQKFYQRVDALFAGKPDPFKNSAPPVAEVRRYLKAATKASTDKYARVERASVISGVLDLASTG